MSKDKNNAPDASTPYSDSPEKSGKVARAKKVATVALSVSATAAIIILLLAVTLNNNSGGGDIAGDFVVRLDQEGKANNMGISTRPGRSQEEDPEVKIASDGAAVLIGQPLGNAWVTSNSVIRTKYDALIAEKGIDGLSGSMNFSNEDDTPIALVYTFYLTNSSTTETQPFRVSARLNHDRGQSQDAKGVDAYEYVRLALFMGDDGKADDDVRYFANRNMRSVPLEGTTDDFRECLSAYNTIFSNKTGNPYRAPAYFDKYGEGEDKKEIGICDPFDPGSDPDYATRGLFDVDDLEMAPGECRRITFMAYLEGEDPDCVGEPPKNQKLGFSLHIGL